MNSVQAQTDSTSICPDRQLLILDAVRPELLPQAVRGQLFEHLCICGQCANLYEEICNLHGGLAESSADLSSDAALHAAEFMTQEQASHDLWGRIAAQQTAEDRHNLRRQMARVATVVAAMAACLLLATGMLWWNRLATLRPKSAVAISTRQPLLGAKPALSGDNPLGEVSLSIPEPASFDLAKTHYETWRDAQKASFAANWPWIFQACETLQTRGIQVDYLDVLMVSGDIRQFHFYPKQPIGQPLAVYEPAAMRRLADYYHVPVDALLPRSDQTALASVAPATTSQALGQWRSAVIAVAASGSQTDLYLYAVQAGPYLAQTRAAAALWVYRHPQEAQKLLSSSDYLSASQIPSHIHDARAWCRMLTDQAVAATQCVLVVNELLRMPPRERCVVEASASWRQLTQSVDVLVTPELKGGD